MRNSIYPRPRDKQTVYPKDVVTGSNIEVGDDTIYNDFVHDPCDFEKIRRSIPAIQTGDLAALEDAE